MGEYGYELITGKGRAKNGLLNGQRMAREIGRVREAAPHGKGSTEGHGEGRDGETRDREVPGTMTEVVTILPSSLEWERYPV